MNFDDPEVRRILRKKSLQAAIAWGKVHYDSLAGDACFHMGALILTTQQTIREEFGEEAYRDTLGNWPAPSPSGRAA